MEVNDILQCRLMSPCAMAFALSCGKLEACQGKVASVFIDSIRKT